MKVLNRLKEFADSRGLTAYALWKATNLSEPTVYRLYKDPTLIPSGKVLEGLAEAFPDTTPNDWLRFEREPEQQASTAKRGRKSKPVPEIGQFVLNPAGWRGWVDKLLPDDRAIVTFENGLTDEYPLHLLSIQDLVVQ